MLRVFLAETWAYVFDTGGIVVGSIDDSAGVSVGFSELFMTGL